MASIGTALTTLATTIGTVLVTLVTSIGTAIVTLATAIGTAMVTLATGIATAATIIAAAAPAIIVTSLLAAGIMAGLNLLKRIFAAGSSGAGDGMGRVVERQDIQTGLLTMIRDTLEANIKTALWGISTKLSTLKDKLVILNTSVRVSGDYLKTSMNYLKAAVGYLQTIAATIGNLAGATTTTTPLITAPSSYGMNSSSAIVTPLRSYQAEANSGTGGRNRSVNVTFNVHAIDRAGVETFLRRDAKPILQRMLAHNEFQVGTASVGG
jgi:hypothetical protein